MLSGLRLRGLKLINLVPSIAMSTPGPLAAPSAADNGITPPSMSDAANAAPAASEVPLQRLSETTAPAPTSATVGHMFEWAVQGGDLGTHRVDDQLMTTIAASYDGRKVSDYVVSAGSLPPDIMMNQTRGTLSGVLRQSGHYVFTIRASIDNVSNDETYSLTVH